MHDPETAEDAAIARKAGGFRRRRESVIRLQYDLPDELTLAALSRVLRIALVDTLALDNGIARNRTLIQAVRTGADLYRDHVLAERIRYLELAVIGHTPAASNHTSLLEVDPEETDDD